MYIIYIHYMYVYIYQLIADKMCEFRKQPILVYVRREYVFIYVYIYIYTYICIYI